MIDPMENNILPSNKIESVFAKIRQCEVCRTSTPPLPVTPNPIIRGNARSVIRIISQAPGTLAHNSSIPFKDPSGRRLRDWLGVDEDTFYNEDNFAITPMGFCFPGQDKNGGDLPPRKECAPLWQNKLDAVLPNVKLTLLKQFALGKVMANTLCRSRIRVGVTMHGLNDTLGSPQSSKS